MHWYTVIPPVSEIPLEIPRIVQLEILLDRATINRRVAELGFQISEELASWSAPVFRTRCYERLGCVVGV